MKTNEGIIIKGGKLSADQLAVGKSATININSATQANDLITKMDALLAVLETEKNNVNNYSDVKQAGETIKDELGKEKPDKNILSVLLTMISNSVPAISSITKAVKVVKEAVELFAK